MSLVDRFVCRREGHKPSATLTGPSAAFVTTYTTKCLRCGKYVEFTANGKEKP